MKKIFYKSISYTDFKGNINKHFDFKDGRNIVYGMNGSGKTTLAESIPYTLFRRGLFGEKINNEPINDRGQVKPDFNQIMKLILNSDGKDYTITKSVVNGIIKAMSINGKPYELKKNFEKEIEENILGISKDEYLMLSNPRFFNTIDNKTARNYVIGLISKSDDINLVNELLENNKELNNDYSKKVIHNLSNGITIDNLIKMKLDEIKVGSDLVKEFNHKLESKKETISTNINIEENKNIDNLIKQKEELEKEILKANESNMKMLDQEKELNSINNEINNCKSDIEALTKFVGEFDIKFGKEEKNYQEKVKEFDTLNAAPFKDKCVLCGSQTEKTKAEADIKKNKELDRLNAEGVELKSILERLKISHENNKKDLVNKKNELDILNKKAANISFSQNRIDTSELQNKINILNSAIGSGDLINKINTQITDLETKRAKQLSILDKFNYEKEFLVSVLKYKATKIEKEINKNLENIKVKLFEIKKNGSLKEIFTVSHKGIDFKRMNNSKQISSGIELINFVQLKKDISLPIFIDNAESINKMEKTDSQTLEMVVTTTPLEVK